MAGPVNRAWLLPGLGGLLDWLILLGVLSLISRAALHGLTSMPSAGVSGNRAPLASLEQAACWLAAAALARRLLGGRAMPAAFLWPLAAAAALCLLSLATTTDLHATREQAFFFIALVLLALTVVICVTSTAKARIFMAGLALLAAAEAVIGIGQFAAREATPSFWLNPTFAGVIRTRIYGTLGNPNVLADFLLVGLGAALLLAVDLPGWWCALPGAALAVDAIALLLTYSRGAYVGFAVFLVAAAVLLRPANRRAWPVLLVVVAVAGLTAARLPSVGFRAAGVALDPGDTAASRLFIWRTGLRMWRAHPLWGTGIGTFNYAYSAFRPEGVLTTYAALRIPGSSHNDYLQLLVESGVAGSAMLGLALLCGLWLTASRYRRGGRSTRIWLGTWGATVAGSGVASFVSSHLFIVTSVIMLTAMTAAVAARESLAQPPLRFWQRLLMLPLVAVLIWLPPLLPPAVRASTLRAEATRDARAGRYVQAVDAFRAAEAADPLYGLPLAYFGDLMADLYLRRIDSSAGPWWTGRELAADLYLRAQRLSPWEGYPHAAFGRLLRTEERYGEAIAAFRDAVRLDPYSPRYRLWLGATLLASGDRAGAAKQLAEAIRLYPLELLVIERHEGHDASARADEMDLAQAQQLLRHLEAGR
jgi:putative inorganic carbon (HCO3(-)) transporter